MNEKRVIELVNEAMRPVLARLDKIERQLDIQQKTAKENEQKQIMVVSEVRKEINGVLTTVMPKINAIAGMVREANFDGGDAVTEYRRSVVADEVGILKPGERPRRDTFQFNEVEENMPIY